jgi:hypothetical protein
VAKHNGMITAQSTLGKGTMIGVHLPGGSKSPAVNCDQRRIGFG